MYIYIYIYNPILPNLGIYHEHLRKSGERCVQALQKVQVPSSRVGPFQSRSLILVHVFQNWQTDTKRLRRGFRECSPTRLPFKPIRTQATFPAKFPRKMIMPGYVRESKNGGRESIAKGFAGFAKEEMKWSFGFEHRSCVSMYFCRWPIPQRPGQVRTRKWRTTGDVFSSL